MSIIYYVLSLIYYLTSKKAMFSLIMQLFK